MSLQHLKPDLTTSQDLSEGAGTALSYTTSSKNRKWQLLEVHYHFSEAITETVTITRDAAAGSDYDTVLAKRSLVGETDFVFRPDGECVFQKGDELLVECTAANDTGSVYVTIKRKELPFN